MSKIEQNKIPLNLIKETPENWVVLKIPAPANYKDEIIYKVFATWSGGYLGSDRWKLNSGIVKVEEDKTYIEISAEDVLSALNTEQDFKKFG